jgi:dTDP-4-dehydrorhamnose 3,5-epimerase
MKYYSTNIFEAFIIEPILYEDDRGYFYESFNHRSFEESLLVTKEFVQDNHSCSKKGVLRGMHFQIKPKEQGKLVRCINGAIFDVIVDIRRDSPTYRHWEGYNLSCQNKKQLWVPEGCAHGFLALEDNTEVLYKTTDYYSPHLERCIKWDDETLGIEWPSANYIISEKDSKGMSFSEWEKETK